MPETIPTTQGRARRAAFFVVAAVTGAFLLVALLGTYPLLFTNWLPAEAWLAARPDRAPGDEVHRLHSLALAIIAWGAFAGVVLQFHRPARRLGALLMSLAAVTAVACGLALAGTLDAAAMVPFLLLPLVTLALHPAAHRLRELPHGDRPMTALVVPAAVGWGLFAVGMAGAARAAGAEGDAEHLAFMAIVALALPLWALLGATAVPGWGVPAGAAVAATACVGLQSLLFPDALSGLAPAWAVAALAWGVAYSVAARRRAGVAAAADDGA